MEEESIRRAIELSMLDFALVVSDFRISTGAAAAGGDGSSGSCGGTPNVRPAHEVLQVSKDASPVDIKKSYRRLARLHHPDKGGDPNEFEELARAYRSLLSSSIVGAGPTASNDNDHRYDHHPTEDSTTSLSIKSTAHWDQELQDHRRLVNELFQADGMDLNACISRQQSAMELLGLAYKDAGATNRNEQNEIIHNSCFYLSLATSYLWGIGALSHRTTDDDDDEDELWWDESNDNEELLVGDTALSLKRTIEAAVVKAHPEWCLQGKVGEEVQAFSDFLVYTLDCQFRDRAVVVFDTVSGFCDIYKGRNYDRLCQVDPVWAQVNTITVRYVPGHYQALIPVTPNARRPSLQDVLTALDDLNVYYVVTDGNS
jgi:hypothetical protein